VQELRAAYDAEAQQTGKPKLLVTAAVAAGKTTIESGYEISKICQDLDYISLMSYDLEGAWNDYTGHNAQLYPRSAQDGDDLFLNVQWAADYWVSQGCPKEKFNIGLPTYGRGFTLTDPLVNGWGAPAKGPAPAGTWTREAGFYSYYEICTMGGTRVWDDEAKVPYVYKNDVWFGYDDKQSLRIKAEWIKSQGFLGVIVWSLDLDDFGGSFCGEGTYPLLTEINMALNGGVETTTTSTTVSTTTLVPTTTTPPPPGSTCEEIQNGYIAHPDDCTKFYQCSNGVGTLNTCSTGTYFNPGANICDWWANLSPERQTECADQAPNRNRQ
jgi:chitinase